MLITGDSAVADVDSSHSSDDEDGDSDDDSESEEEEETRRPEFNHLDVAQWVRNANNVISRKIRERNQYDDYRTLPITRSDGHSAL